MPKRRRRFDFSNIGHCDRREELEKLVSLACDNHENEDGTEQQRGVLIEAESGVGKSVLLDQFATTMKKKDNKEHIIVARGKFEEGIAEPFQALGNATQELVRQLIEDDRDAWSRRIRKAVDKDAQILVEVFPCMRLLLLLLEEEKKDAAGVLQISSSSEEPTTTTTNTATYASSFRNNKDDSERTTTPSEQEEGSGDMMGLDCFSFGNLTDREWRFERFRMSFRAFVRCVVASQRRSIIFVLDDCHWAEPDSLAVIKTLLEDPELTSTTNKSKSSFFFVGATRPLDQYPRLRRLLVEDSQGPILTRMGLSRLTSGEIGLLACRLLDRPDNSIFDRDIAELADVVQAKTRGNAFVVMQFFRLLDQKQLLKYSEQDSQWRWDLDRIANETSISDDVADLVADNLQSVDPKLKSLLIVAASFGMSHFNIETVVHAVPVFDAECSEEDQLDPVLVRRSSISLSSRLGQAVHEGYLVQVKPGHYRFAHDRIREAAYSLLPEGKERKDLHLKIGRQLKAWMDIQSELGYCGLSEQSLLLHATKQLNAGSDLIDDTWERLDLAELNFQSAELAARKTAFSQAMEHLLTGLEHLGEGRWRDHYSLALKLTAALARIQYSNGLFSDSERTCDEVLAHAGDFAEKRAVYHTKLLCMMQQKQHQEALDLCLGIFDELGHPFPRRMPLLQVMTQYFSVNRFMKTVSDKDILNMKYIDDKKLKFSFEFMERVLELAFFTGDARALYYLVLLSLRVIHVLVERGGSPVPCMTVINYAFVRAQLGDFLEATRFGRLAIKLAGRSREEYPGSSSRHELFYWWSIHWHRPAREGLAPTIAIFDKLWKLGHLDYVHMDKDGLLRLMFACGEPLKEVARECKGFSESLLDYKQNFHWNRSATLYQTVLNLISCPADGDPTQLTGEHMDENIHVPQWNEEGNDQAVFRFQLFIAILSYHFKDFQKAKRAIKQMRKSLWVDGPDFLLVTNRVFYTGLTYLALARETKKNKYRRRARSSIKLLLDWTNKGAVNCRYMYLLLKAEDLACDKNAGVNHVRSNYDNAILEVGKLELRHHLALANELAGSYLLLRRQTSCKETAEGRHHIEKAIEHYSWWGANTIVRDLELRHKSITAEEYG